MGETKTIQTIRITREDAGSYWATASNPETKAHGQEAGEALLNLIEKLYPDAKYRRSGIHHPE